MAKITKACKGVSYPKSSSVSSRLGSPAKAKKGGKFDLNGDGKTTFKDVLIGRGVLPKTAKKGKMIKKAQNGDSETEKKFAEERKMMRRKEVENSLSKPMIKPKISKFVGPMQPGKSRPMMKKGGSVKKSMKTGGKMKKCAYGCK